MQLKLTKTQFKELLLDVMIGVFIRGAVAELKDKDWQRYEKLENYLLSVAKEKGFKDLVQNFKGSLLPSEKLCKQEEEIREAYEEDEFWTQLTTRLGQRDFVKEMTKSDKEHMEKNRWLPEKIQKYYQKYDKEFEKYGIDRLEIQKIKN